MSARPEEDETTIFQPGDGSPPLPAKTIEAPRRARSGLPAGTLLNNIYEVRRFIARGGMGEVYEGVNVNTDERVAIKVMLPHLAADAKVQAMFRKEARILTELAHPALVRYRVLAHEPQLELFYIVTEYIDGPSLSEKLGELKVTAETIKALVRRLAEGLASAHALGAVHRDMSPDNVLLPQGRLDQAKIIDFGIARESSLAHQTVVGEGFAGKMGYVAPEQFGDFGRRVGPWTDVYSLGLVGLALASKRAPDMGVTLVDAVDRRREGVDLARLPASLRPVFKTMLAPNPKDRFQTMAAVIEALDALDQPDAATAPADVEAQDHAAPARSWLLPAGAAALLLCGAAAVGLILAGGPGRREAPIKIAAESLAAPTPQPAEIAAPVVAEPAPPEVVDSPAPLPTLPRKPKAVAKAPPRETIQIASRPITVPAAAPSLVPARPLVLAAPATALVGTTAPKAENQVEACWRAAGSAWTYIGYASRSSCVAQAFNACPVIHGRWGKTQLRRYDGKLQAKGTGLLSNWQTVGASECPAGEQVTTGQ